MNLRLTGKVSLNRPSFHFFLSHSIVSVSFLLIPLFPFSACSSVSRFLRCLPNWLNLKDFDYDDDSVLTLSMAPGDQSKARVLDHQVYRHYHRKMIFIACLRMNTASKSHWQYVLFLKLGS